MKRRLTIEIELTDEEFAALAFKIDEGRGVYNDPRRPRLKRSGSETEPVITAALKGRLKTIAREAVSDAKSHDSMVAINTQRPRSIA